MGKSKASRPSSPSRSKATLRVTLFLVACPLLLALAGAVLTKHPNLSSVVVMGAIAVLGTSALTALFVRWDGLKLDDVGADVVPRSGLRLVLGFLVGTLLVTLQTLITNFAGHVQWVRAPEVALSQSGIALLGFLLLAAREELAFRGYPLRRLEKLFGPYQSLLLLAVVFALEHLAGGYTWSNALFGAGVGALLFGMAALATRGLALPIGLHTAWNFGQWILGNTEFPGPWKPVIDPGLEHRVGQTEMISYVVVMLLATFIFWRLHTKAICSVGK